MLFKNKICSKCGSEYDVVNDTCPACHTRNEEFEALRIPKHLVWLPVHKQLLLFALGILVLNLISALLQLALMNVFEEGNATLLLIVNYSRYCIVLGLMAIVLIHSYSNFKKSFVEWLPYVVGIIVGGLLIGFNLAYNNIINIFHEIVPNQNQTYANNLVGTYPILSFFLLVFIGPTVEELTYRVGLFTFLHRINKYLAYAITTIIFAFIHFNYLATGPELIDEFISLPVYMISGFTLCLIYDLFGLSASLTAHFTNNLLSVIPVILRALITR